MRDRNIIFYGHHKCGSRFFRKHILKTISDRNGMRLMEYEIPEAKGEFAFRSLEALDLHNVNFAALKNGNVALGLANSSQNVVRAVLQSDPSALGIHVIRDPRQVLVSSYFHHLEGHNTKSPLGWRWLKLEEDRKVLLNLSPEEGVEYEMNNITKDLLEGQIRPWKRSSNVFEIKLEELSGNFRAIMETMCNFLGIDNITFDSSSRFRMPNEASQPWEEVFTPRLRELFKDRYNDILVEWGYEQDRDW